MDVMRHVGIRGRNFPFSHSSKLCLWLQAWKEWHRLRRASWVEPGQTCVNIVASDFCAPASKLLLHMTAECRWCFQGGEITDKSLAEHLIEHARSWSNVNSKTKKFLWVQDGRTLAKYFAYPVDPNSNIMQFKAPKVQSAMIMTHASEGLGRTGVGREV